MKIAAFPRRERLSLRFFTRIDIPTVSLLFPDFGQKVLDQQVGANHHKKQEHRDRRCVPHLKPDGAIVGQMVHHRVRGIVGGRISAQASDNRADAERPANESQVGISRFQFRKKATRSQTAERSKIETAVGQRGVQYEIRSAPVCLDKQLPRRSRYAGTCWQKPSCRPCKAFLRNAFCP